MKGIDFIVGEKYGWSTIPQDERRSDLENNEYGGQLVGQNAIHLRFIEKGIARDVWFIYDEEAPIEDITDDPIFKCVYNAYEK